MKIKLNDKEITISAKTLSLKQLLTLQKIKGKHFAIAINGQFIHRSDYGQFNINGNEKIDIVTPMQGG